MSHEQQVNAQTCGNLRRDILPTSSNYLRQFQSEADISRQQHGYLRRDIYPPALIICVNFRVMLIYLVHNMAISGVISTHQL
ncbi:hypothetical protein RRG08_004915 [Elysia crispata]|uniref:Uncharacterized protein n=1 Tax=Elysia crispata TaxID=231223 RepID=A0AAE1DHI1_9GAST|nr:hypothetical protein RRG08_004915 [Elysia crispata]